MIPEKAVHCLSYENSWFHDIITTDINLFTIHIADIYRINKFPIL